MDKLLDKEVHQLFKPSPNDPEVSNYLASTVSSCSKHSATESASAMDAADEGLGVDCQEELKPAAAGSTYGKNKSKPSAVLRYICICCIFCHFGAADIPVKIRGEPRVDICIYTLIGLSTCL